MSTCPCCSATLLRHVRHNSIYWFCTHCWQEMPDFSSEIALRSRMTSNTTPAFPIREVSLK